MIDSLTKLLQTLIPVINDPARRNRAFGRSLVTLHHYLDTVLDNADEIVNLLSSFNREEEIDTEDLLALIYEQRALISRINKLFNGATVAPVLAVKMPEVKPLSLLLSGKDKRLSLLLDAVSNSDQKHYGVTPFNGFSVLRMVGSELDFPDDNSIRRSKYALDKIRELRDQLRAFIVENYTLEQLV